MMPRPPGLADWLLRRCLPHGAAGESIRGDLYEEFCLREPAWRRGVWYWWHAVAIGIGYLGGGGEPRRRPVPPTHGGRRNPWGQDIRYAGRLMRKRPGFTALTVSTLALGIGATTAIVSVVDRVLLRALPYPAAHELVTIWNTYPYWRGHEVLDPLWDRIHLSYPEYIDLREGQRAFQSVAIYTTGQSTLSGVGDPTLIDFGTASASLFPLLGANPVVGRTFRQEEEALASTRVAVISYRLWTGRFEAAPDIADRSVTVDGERYTVIGVLPEGFRLRSLTRGGTMTPDIWVPAGIFGNADDRGQHSYETIARLEPGVTLEQAEADAGPLLRGRYSPERQDVRILDRQTEEVGSARGPLLLLLGSATLLMLIAGVNVATLFMAESTSRRHELATRRALGATRGRVIKQLMAESGVIGVCGAAAGLVVALIGRDLLLRLAPPELVLPEHIPLDLRILVFTMALGVAIGVAFGVGPALMATREDMGAALHRRTTAGNVSTAKIQRGMVAGEAALSVVLLVVAALLGRSLLAMRAVDPGFERDNIAALSLPLSGPRTQEPQVQQLARDLIARVGALPGVTHVTGASTVPFSGQGGSSSFTIEGRPVGADEKMPEAHRRTILPGFHEALAIPLVAGRTITDAGRRGADPVVVVSETMARRYWPDASPIGRFIVRNNRRWQIIGIVDDILHQDLTGDRQSTFYFPFYQQTPTQFWLMVRTAVPLQNVMPEVRAVMAEVAP
ncbi:MAG: ABC transporter permease, partial [Gemmatimonadetes bacterium]|nr:ABC transporter permease [Gemmatimonadota bacterium]